MTPRRVGRRAVTATPKHYTLTTGPNAGKRVLYLNAEAIAERERMANAETWAPRIRPHLEQAVEHIVAAGQQIAEAKCALPRGEFGRLAELLGMSARTMQRFMAIAANPVLSDATHVSHLPASWGTLYELSRMEPARLEAAIVAGEITPRLERNAAKQLVVHDHIEARSAVRQREGTPVERAIRDGVIRDEAALAQAREMIRQWSGLAGILPPRIVARTVIEEPAHMRRNLIKNIRHAREFLDELDAMVTADQHPLTQQLRLDGSTPDMEPSAELVQSLETVAEAMKTTWRAISKVPAEELGGLTSELQRHIGPADRFLDDLEDERQWGWWWYHLADGQWKDRMGVEDVLRGLCNRDVEATA